jgi:hypothetical protein
MCIFSMQLPNMCHHNIINITHTLADICGMFMHELAYSDVNGPTCMNKDMPN